MKLAMIAALLLLTPSALLAQAVTSTAANTQQARDSQEETGDPNRMVCRNEKTTGSRLGRQRICMTAQQWADQQRIDRQAVERSQAGRYKND